MLQQVSLKYLCHRFKFINQHYRDIDWPLSVKHRYYFLPPVIFASISIADHTTHQNLSEAGPLNDSEVKTLPFCSMGSIHYQLRVFPSAISSHPSSALLILTKLPSKLVTMFIFFYLISELISELRTSTHRQWTLHIHIDKKI